MTIGAPMGQDSPAMTVRLSRTPPAAGQPPGGVPRKRDHDMLFAQESPQRKVAEDTKVILDNEADEGIGGKLGPAEGAWRIVRTVTEDSTATCQ